MTQLYGLTGKKRRTPYARIVEAEADLLPEVKARADRKAYDDKMYGLRLKELEQGQNIIDFQREHAEDEEKRLRRQFEYQKKADDKARDYKYAGMAVDALMNRKEGGWLDDTVDYVTSGVKKVGKAGGEAVGNLYEDAMSGLISMIFD